MTTKDGSATPAVIQYSRRTGSSRWALIDGVWYVERSVVEARDLYVEGALARHTGSGEPVDP